MGAPVSRPDWRSGWEEGRRRRREEEKRKDSRCKHSAASARHKHIGIAACTTREAIPALSPAFSNLSSSNPMNTNPVRPAHHTKHLSLLQHPFRASSFHLTQRNNGQTNGTALWLGAQCLALYLAHICARKSTIPSHRRPTVVELGSGIGLSAYVRSPLLYSFLQHGVYSVASSPPVSQARSLFPRVGCPGHRSPRCHRIRPFSQYFS